MEYVSILLFLYVGDVNVIFIFNLLVIRFVFFFFDVDDEDNDDCNDDVSFRCRGGLKRRRVLS